MEVVLFRELFFRLQLLGLELFVVFGCHGRHAQVVVYGDLVVEQVQPRVDDIRRVIQQPWNHFIRHRDGAGGDVSLRSLFQTFPRIVLGLPLSGVEASPLSRLRVTEAQQVSVPQVMHEVIGAVKLVEPPQRASLRLEQQPEDELVFQRLVFLRKRKCNLTLALDQVQCHILIMFVCQVHLVSEERYVHHGQHFGFGGRAE